MMKISNIAEGNVWAGEKNTNTNTKKKKSSNEMVSIYMYFRTKRVFQVLIKSCLCAHQ